jgi:hypothetical protein
MPDGGRLEKIGVEPDFKVLPAAGALTAIATAAGSGGAH